MLFATTCPTANHISGPSYGWNLSCILLYLHTPHHHQKFKFKMLLPTQHNSTNLAGGSYNYDCARGYNFVKNNWWLCCSIHITSEHKWMSWKNGCTVWFTKVSTLYFILSIMHAVSCSTVQYRIDCIALAVQISSHGWTRLAEVFKFCWLHSMWMLAHSLLALTTYIP